MSELGINVLSLALSKMKDRLWQQQRPLIDWLYTTQSSALLDIVLCSMWNIRGLQDQVQLLPSVNIIGRTTYQAMRRDVLPALVHHLFLCIWSPSTVDPIGSLLPPSIMLTFQVLFGTTSPMLVLSDPIASFLGHPPLVTLPDPCSDRPRWITYFQLSSKMRTNLKSEGNWSRHALGFLAKYQW